MAAVITFSLFIIIISDKVLIPPVLRIYRYNYSKERYKMEGASQNNPFSQIPYNGGGGPPGYPSQVPQGYPQY
jgi:hypothetical protein